MTTYGKIENGKYISAPNLEIDKLKLMGFEAFDEGLVALCLGNQITTDELIIKQENLEKIAVLQSQIDELDKKRIRALAEPSKKNETKTWLEYYNEQIQALREEMAGL